MKIVVCTGGFDPCHSGHLQYFIAARQLGDRLIVGLNSDEWLIRKKGRTFMRLEERRSIISNLKPVDAVLTFDDSDGTAQSLLKELTKKYPDDTFVFANGGDRDYNNTPEHDTPGVIFAYGVGGSEKTNSSSQLLEDWSLPKVERPWGYYRVLKNMTGSKVKELVINPGKSLSMQRHRLRSEHWHVVENQCNVELERKRIKTLVIHNQLKVEVGKWHRLYNPYENPCKLIEIQYGELCDEADIERK